MKQRALRFIVCPHCRGQLKLEREQTETIEYSSDALLHAHEYINHLSRNSTLETPQQILESITKNITSGDLICQSCAASFPILNGIPRLLPPELRTTPSSMGRGDPTNDARLGFFDDSLDAVSPHDPTFAEVQLANQSNYGYEWQAFSHEYDQWESIYKENYMKVDLSTFRNLRGIDAGCGMARYSLPLVQHGAEVVGLDLSNAIEAAYKKSLLVPFFHAIQGDIFHLPFVDGFFDFAQSLGVIHITPNPEIALLSIKRVVKPEGRLFIYVYQSYKKHNFFKHVLLSLVMQLRKITMRMPSNILYAFLYLLIPVVYITCYLPSAILWFFPPTRKFSDIFPYSYVQYRDRKLRDIHMNLFDRFGNPVERRYTEEEMVSWISKVGFKTWNLRDQYGWHVEAVNS